MRCAVVRDLQRDAEALWLYVPRGDQLPPGSVAETFTRHCKFTVAQLHFLDISREHPDSEGATLLSAPEGLICAIHLCVSSPTGNRRACGF